MQYKAYTNNSVMLLGRVSKVHEYSPGKAANVTIAIDNGKDRDGADRPTSFVQTKCFSPATYAALKPGMLVKLHGHMSPGSYERDGRTIYTQDVVSDFIDFLEPKATVAAREAAKAEVAENDAAGEVE